MHRRVARATRAGGRAADLARAVRVRVRLRTRLRRAREAWRRTFPRRLPRWVEPAPARPTPPDGAAGSGTAPTAASVLSGGRVVADPAAANPRGRQRYGPPLATGELVLRGDGAGGVRWEIARTADRVPVVAGRVGEPLDARQSAVLAELAAVDCPPPGPDTPAGAWARVVAPLAMTGVVLHAPSPPAGLDPELAGQLATPLPGRDADPMAWELRSVGQRRVAIRQHAAGLGRLGQPPPVSALLVTKRPWLLADALAALVGQTYPELEIVVAVHGAPAPTGLPAGGRTLRVVEVPASRVLGEALAAASAVATGALVTKVDDDDRYGAEHIWDLVLARHYTGATVVGKGAEFVYLEPKDLTVRRRMAAEADTDTVAGGTITLAREVLADSGGWPPVPHSVDRALLDQVLGAGGTVYRTHPLGFIYTRHGDGHTWDPGLEYFRRDPVRTWQGLPRYAEFGTQFPGTQLPGTQPPGTDLSGSQPGAAA